MVGGVGLLAYAFAARAEVGSAASTDDMLAFLVLGLAFALLCALLANLAARRATIVGAAVGFGAAAGVCYAIATLATRQIGLAVNERREGHSTLVDLLTTPTPYVLVLFSVLALGLQQRGLQGRAAVIAFPVTSGVSAFLPVTLGLTLFDEPAPDGGQRVALVVAMVMVASGIGALGRDRMAANRSVDELESSPTQAGGDTGEVRSPAGTSSPADTRLSADAPRPADTPRSGSVGQPGDGSGSAGAERRSAGSKSTSASNGTSNSTGAPSPTARPVPMDASDWAGRGRAEEALNPFPGDGGQSPALRKLG